MPAPKQFNRGPQTTVAAEHDSRPVAVKGKYSVITAPARTVEGGAVEVAVDDVTVVMKGVSKYAQRSLHGYGEVGDEEGEESEETAETVPEPVRPATPSFGEWRSESTLEGTHYHRKDSRLI